jgi:hypothetical protein
MPTIDQIYRYRSLAAQRQGYCRLRIYKRRDGGQTVLLTEVANNPGQSITAASDVIATGLVARYHLDPATTFWIEHWPADPSDKLSENAYASVKYTWLDGVAASPRWRRLSLERAEEMTGTRLQEQGSANSVAGADPSARRS